MHTHLQEVWTEGEGGRIDKNRGVCGGATLDGCSCSHCVLCGPFSGEGRVPWHLCHGLHVVLGQLREEDVVEMITSGAPFLESLVRRAHLSRLWGFVCGIRPHPNPSCSCRDKLTPPGSQDSGSGSQGVFSELLGIRLHCWARPWVTSGTEYSHTGTVIAIVLICAPTHLCPLHGPGALELVRSQENCCRFL